MRICSIDVGSNAIRLVIFEIHKNGQWEQLKKFRAPLRLGTDVFTHKKLLPNTILQLNDVFKKISKINKSYQVDKTIALATSAMRGAKNKKLIINQIFKTSRIKIRVISGQEEARIIRQAIIKSRSNHYPESLLIDIGGGSAELTGLHLNQVLFSKSFPLGVVRLLQIYHSSEAELNAYLDGYFKKIKPLSKKFKFNVAVGTGGNFDALARLKLNLLRKAPQTRMSKEEVSKIYIQWTKMSLSEKEQLGLRSDRIDVFHLALNLILRLMKEFNIKLLKIPMTGLKEGSIHELI